MEELKNAKGLKLPFPREIALKKDCLEVAEKSFEIGVLHIVWDVIKSEMEVPNIASSKAYALATSFVPHMTNTFPFSPSRGFFFATLEIYYSPLQNSPSKFNSCLKRVIPLYSLISHGIANMVFLLLLARPLNEAGELWANKIDPL
ncbi:hypothetical protein VNO77_16068 [Canavalia gladiata]|uniref:Uncharacterized protein n=1 Tax=Canavalia gladiata TaxID=3824 RepID=A0AAN9M0H3_CANGL